jgi:ribosomal protein S18 acetylase RimI-like enzyme
MTVPRIASLSPEHRTRLTDILRQTGVFRDEEVGIALELFDEAFPSPTSTGSSDYEFLGAFDDNDVLMGFACYGPTPETDQAYDLYWLAVDPAAQHEGTGTLILRAVEGRLRETRGRLVVAETSSRPEYDATRAFYESRGYREAARIREFYAPGDDRIIYTKRIELGPRRVSQELKAHE